MSKGLTDAKRKAIKKYDETHTRQLNMKLNLKTDADIFEHLNKQESVQGYIKGLIRKDIEMKIPEVTVHNFRSERKEIEQSLKPCPFCGNNELEFSLIHPQFANGDDADYWCYWQILCPECGAEMENARLHDQTWEEAKKEIIDNWNHRA